MSPSFRKVDDLDFELTAEPGLRANATGTPAHDLLELWRQAPAREGNRVRLMAQLAPLLTRAMVARWPNKPAEVTS